MTEGAPALTPLAALTVGAVIVNYNAGAHLVDCVRSLIDDGVGAERIVVVDNGSSDDSLASLAGIVTMRETEGDPEPSVTLVRLPHNPGYGAGMNAGVSRLVTDVVLCLNCDTVLQPGAVDALIGALASSADLGVVGPRLEDSDGTLYPSARRFPSWREGIGHALLGLVWSANPWSRRYKNLGVDHERARRVDWVSGAAMALRRTAFDAVGGFDEGYFMYMEDVDLCWRLRASGWLAAYQPEAVVTHVRGVSTDPTPYRFIVAHHRSLVRYHRRTASGLGRLLLPIVVAGLAVRAPLACVHRWRAGRRGSHPAVAPDR